MPLTPFFNKLNNLVVKYKLYHLPFWGTYVVLLAFLLSPIDEFQYYLPNAAILVFFHAAVSYFNNYLLFPLYLFNRKYVLYVLSLLLSISLVCFPIAFVYYRFLIEDEMQKNLVWTSDFFINNALFILFTVAITASIRLFSNWYKQQISNRQLEKLNIENELKFLKTQINPHFLFNSLNNLYALTLKKSDNAPEIVLKLSNILRYVLYEGTAQRVPLTKEIEYLQDYLELERLRLGGRATIKFETEGNLFGCQIEPMLFINFLENSFKHGVSTDAGISWVHILLSVDKEQKILEMKIENSKPEKPDIIRQHGGIGLENVKKRLMLLYPDTHTLNIEDKKNTYIVHLKLLLKP